MGSKIKAALIEHHTLILIWVFAIRFLFFELGPAEVLGALVLFLSSLALRVCIYLLPKQPDLYTQVKELNDQILNLTTKSETHERDITGLKFSSKR